MLRVLVADADPLHLRFLQSFLELRGARVLSAMDEVEAMRLLARHDFDLIFVDIDLPASEEGPQRGGAGLIGLLKSNPRTSRIPIIATVEGSESLLGCLAEAETLVSLKKPYQVNRLCFQLKEITASLKGDPRLNEWKWLGEVSAGDLPLVAEYEVLRALRFKQNLSCVSIVLRERVPAAESALLIDWVYGALPQPLCRSAHVFLEAGRELVLLLPQTTVEEANSIFGQLKSQAANFNGFGALAVGFAGCRESNVTSGVGLLACARGAWRKTEFDLEVLDDSNAAS